ncbi:MAG: glycolate oxidase subunit GlcE [Steroidobacteraceae bacterium]
MIEPDRGTLLRPRDEAEVAEIIAATGGPLEPVGGGTKRAVGRPSAARPLELGALRGILDYEPEELVITARAATPLAEVQAVLRERGQRLAFEPPDWTGLLGAGAHATLGGVIAANASGSRRVAAGAARDHFLGFRAVSGRGERFQGGGRVVKNVTGYDLPKLLAGSWGTLAVLTEVTVRVHPLPECERTLVIGARDPAAAVRVMSAALGSPCDVSSAAFAPRLGIALRLEGFARSVEARSRALEEVLKEALELQAARGDCRSIDGPASARLWEEVGGVQSLAGHPIVWRLSIAPSEAPRLLERIDPEDYLLDWGGGLVWIGASAAEPARVRGALEGGHATLFKAPREVRSTVPAFQPLPAPLAAVSARVKAAFDPAGRLNPGRMS